MSKCITAFVPFVWILLCGTSVFYCSSGTGTGLIVKSGVSSNRAPVAKGSSLTAQVNVPASGFMQASDDDGDDLVFSVILTPTLGVVNITDTSTGAFSYVSNATGSDSFSFKASDGKTDSNVATVRIAVMDVQLSWRPSDQADTSVMPGGRSDKRPYAIPRCASAQPIHGLGAVRDPFDCSHIIRASAGPMLLRSSDAGLSWMEPEINALLSDQDLSMLIHFNTTVPGLIYVAINARGGLARLARSRDGGVHWQVIGVSLFGHFESLRSGRLDETGCLKIWALFNYLDTVSCAVDCPFAS